jgi:hypothetical protein
MLDDRRRRPSTAPSPVPLPLPPRLLGWPSPPLSPVGPPGLPVAPALSPLAVVVVDVEVEGAATMPAAPPIMGLGVLDATPIMPGACG